MKQKQWAYRLVMQVIGMFFMCLGISLNTTTGFGVSCITAAYYAIYKAGFMSFFAASMVIYMIMMAIEFALKGKNRDWKDLLQIPFSLALSWLLEWMEQFFTFLRPEGFVTKLLVMAVGIFTIGVGTSIMVNMRIVTGPPDGLAAAIGVALKKNTGFGKNMLDTLCVIVAGVIDLYAHGRFFSIGLGTVMSMIFVGRSVAVTDHFFREKMLKKAGFLE